MKTRSILFLGGVLLVGLLLSWPSVQRAFQKPMSVTSSAQQRERKCPVCGMFLAPFRDWLATLRFRDGFEVSFDGVKDLFRYYWDVSRYDPGRTAEQVEAVQVTEYYSLRAIDGYQSRYVIGSDVLGPMGHELIPFAADQAAEEFLRDHHGERVLTFTEVTRDVISHLDNMPRETKR